MVFLDVFGQNIMHTMMSFYTEISQLFKQHCSNTPDRGRDQIIVLAALFVCLDTFAGAYAPLCC